VRAGVCNHRISVRELLKERLFPGRIPLPEPWAEHYWGRVPTRQIAHSQQHTLKYAT
jgi:hypothetical protein